MLENVKVLCHSSVKIAGAKVLYFDPFKIENETHDADLIFVTHDHYDHFSPEDIAKIITPSTLLIAPLSIREAVSKEGYKNVLYISPGETKTIAESSSGISENTAAVFESSSAVSGSNIAASAPSVTVTAIRSYNPGKPFHPADKNYVGYIVKMDGTTYYVAGDTDITDEALKVSCDVAIVPVGGKYTMDAAEAAELVNSIRPKFAVPTHYGSVVGKADDGERFAALVRPEVQVLYCR